MRIIHHQTSNLMEGRGNVVDLGEFRRRLAATQRDSLARRREPLYEELEAAEDRAEEAGFQPVVLTMSSGQRRRSRRERRDWTLDACASLAVVLMTLVFALRIML